MNLTDLSDLELARLLLSRLWRTYDAEGISVGRSLRAALVEEINSIILCPEVGENEIELANLIQEADRRLKSKENSRETQLLLWPDELCFLDDVSLSYVLLLVLLDWYAKDAIKSEHPLNWERGIVLKIARLWRYENHCEHLEPKSMEGVVDVLAETKDRFRARWKKELEEQY